MVLSPNLDKELVKSSNVEASQVISALLHLPRPLSRPLPLQFPMSETPAASIYGTKEEWNFLNTAHLKIPLTQVVPKFCCILELPGSLKSQKPR